MTSWTEAIHIYSLNLLTSIPAPYTFTAERNSPLQCFKRIFPAEAILYNIQTCVPVI